ncbi:hypothetical protein CEXT_411971 [Caerostris extrusa]|uniref:Uncharacterized protein n=1 Tax=Caerostris extrusa TaxID=172846 RepID=A0AAV4UIE8_CAEEX|nr:hypothetical protein CEXT_411971 [Caerostris extrusa]
MSHFSQEAAHGIHFAFAQFKAALKANNERIAITPNHHLVLHGDTFKETPSTLSQTQPSRHTLAREKSLQLVELELIRSSRNSGSITSREPSYVSDVEK